MLTCPKCGNITTFTLEVTTSLPVTQDDTGFLEEGLPESGGYAWNDDSLCWCGRCQHRDVLLAFAADDEEDEDPDMQGPPTDGDVDAFLVYWHNGETPTGHWSSPHGCHMNCPVCSGETWEPEEDSSDA